MELLDRLGHASSKAEDGAARAALAARLERAPELGARRRAAPAGDEPGRVPVLVTGGSRGIGRAIALRFARDGATRVAIGYLRNDAAAEAAAESVRAAGAEPVLVRGNVASKPRVVEEVAALGPARRARPQRGDGRDPAGARDRGQALGLDDERERARAAVARAGRRAADAARLVDRRDLEPRLAARARELRPRRHVEGRARGARPLPRRRARAARDPRQRRLRRRRRHRRARALPEPGRDAALRSSATPGGPARRAGRRRRRRSRSSARPTRQMVRGQTLVVDGGFSLPA